MDILPLVSLLVRPHAQPALLWIGAQPWKTRAQAPRS
eukprot:COSAG06_NODE_52845_length_303_cov_1.024510_1_plen_36_part_01